MVGSLDREPNVIETSMALDDYGDSLLIPNDEQSRQKLIDQVGPIQVWRILGQTSHICMVNTHPHCDHDEEEALVISRLEPTWRCFAIAYNPEAEWEVRHYEPARDARPL